MILSSYLNVLYLVLGLFKFYFDGLETTLFLFFLAAFVLIAFELDYIAAHWSVNIFKFVAPMFDGYILIFIKFGHNFWSRVPYPNVPRSKHALFSPKKKDVCSQINVY